MLFLGPAGSSAARTIEGSGLEVARTDEPVDPELVRRGGFALLVSHGYRHIVPATVLDLLRGRAVNLHISLLPWNRGAHPNVWSAYEGTPAGVTVHHMDAGVDTGDLIAQREVEISDDETLRSSYDLLQREIAVLFDEVWPSLLEGTAARTAQRGSGSSHRAADLERISHALPQGWDTPVGAVRAAGRGHR